MPITPCHNSVPNGGTGRYRAPMSRPHVRSLHVSAALRRIPGLKRRTAIARDPVDAVEVRDPGPKRGGLGSGVVGDVIGEPRYHGGSRQAVYAFARAELDWWEAELGRDLPDGMFGENVTVADFDVDGALIGEQWRVGNALLEVTCPRTPCATFAARMQEPRWVKRFSARGRTGAYLAVVEPGRIETGDDVVVVHRPDHDVTVPDHFRAITGDRRLARHIVEVGALGPFEHEWLAARL